MSTFDKAWAIVKEEDDPEYPYKGLSGRAKERNRPHKLVKIPKTDINYRYGKRYRSPETGEEYKVLPLGFTVDE